MSEFTVIAIGNQGHQISTCRDAERAQQVFMNCIKPKCEYFTVALYKDGDLADIVMRPSPFIPLRLS